MQIETRPEKLKKDKLVEKYKELAEAYDDLESQYSDLDDTYAELEREKASEIQKRYIRIRITRRPIRDIVGRYTNQYRFNK